MLAGLDRDRQRAYAGNDPTPLSAVYANVDLLRQDRSTLRHVVPSGCRLLGLRTVYRGVHASAVTATQAVVGAQVSLEPAQLVCAHRSALPMAPHSPVAMTIVLQRVAGQFRIDAITMPT